MLEPVHNPMYVEGVTMEVEPQIPRGFLEVAGRLTTQKVRLANHMLVDFMMKVKMLRIPKGTKVPYLAPKTQNMRLRVLLGVMKDFYGWEIEMDDLDGFEGCLVGVTAELYKQCHLKYVSIMICENSYF